MNRHHSQAGFSLMELIVVIVVISLLTVTAASKWPTGLGEDAAAKEFMRAVRYAQHMAITQPWTSAEKAWGIASYKDQYTVQRADGSEEETSLDYSDRSLLNNETITDESVYFNGLGEPIDIETGQPLETDTKFNIGSSTVVTVIQETGYVQLL